MPVGAAAATITQTDETCVSTTDAQTARMPPGGRVLSVQSHVVHGYVGNKSAVFPLQLLGMEVDPINSVQFSNHTGYPNGFTGERLAGEHLLSLVEGLEKNALLDGYTHLLTGYIGSVSFLQMLLKVVGKLREASPGLVYVCDPVLGDEGKLYVPAELVEIYREQVLPLATILTPNQFECELLSGTKVRTEADAAAACEVLHARGPSVILLTSCSFTADDSLTVIVSERKQSTWARYRIVVPKLPGYFTGTGDLIAALFLAWCHRLSDPKSAAENAVATVQAVLQRTRTEGGEQGRKELRLIASRSDIDQPKIMCQAIPMD